jgi:hypothetical protein
MSWSILDGMRLMFQRAQELDLKELQADALRLLERSQGGGTSTQDSPSRVPPSNDRSYVEGGPLVGNNMKTAPNGARSGSRMDYTLG